MSNSRKLAGLAMLCAVLWCNFSHGAISVNVQAGGQVVDLSEVAAIGNSQGDGGKLLDTYNASITLGDGTTMTFSATGDPDPFIQWAWSVVNPGPGTVNYAVSFSQPIVALPAGTYTVLHTASGSVTDGGDGSVVIGGNTTGGEMVEAIVNGSILGGFDLLPAFTATNFPSDLIPAETVGPVNVNFPGGLAGNITSQIRVSVPAGDSLSLNGRLQIDFVPEPASVAIWSVLCAACLGFRRRG